MKMTSVVWAVTVAVFAASMTMLVASRPAAANPQFAQQTGKACAFCHTAPPALNDQGKAFKAKGNKL
jgi:cytochrome c553